MLLFIEVVEYYLFCQRSYRIRVELWVDEDGGRRSRIGEREDSSAGNAHIMIERARFRCWTW